MRYVLSEFILTCRTNTFGSVDHFRSFISSYLVCFNPIFLFFLHLNKHTDYVCFVTFKQDHLFYYASTDFISLHRFIVVIALFVHKVYWKDASFIPIYFQKETFLVLSCFFRTSNISADIATLSYYMFLYLSRRDILSFNRIFPYSLLASF